MKKKNLVKRLGAMAMALTLSFGTTLTYGATTSNLSNSSKTVTEAKIDLEKVKGTEVTFYGWGGSEKTNAWIDNELAKIMKDKYGITLKRVGMNIDQILNQLVSEKQANKNPGTIDVIWINGENFYTAKKNGLLYGSIAESIPNYNKYIDANNTENTIDFATPTEGFEVPYGRAQVVMIQDTAALPKLVKSTDDLMKLAMENKGKITYPAPPDFTGSAFVRNILCDIVGYETILNCKNDEAKLREVLAPGFKYLKDLKPYLWKEGKTYPADVTTQDNLFQDGELSFTVSYNPFSVLSKVESGHFPKTSKVTLFDKGTVGNTHFVSIAYNTPNFEGAKALINEIISVQAQSTKYDPKVWGDLPVLDNAKLSEEEKATFKKIELGENALPQDELLSKRIPELPAETLLIIEKIWNEEIPSKQ